jgi:hypothetical protein
MDEYQQAKLRLECLQLVQGLMIARHAPTYSIVNDAKEYWEFVRGPVEQAYPAGSLQTPGTVDADFIPF